MCSQGGGAEMGKTRMGLVEALRELAAILADCWRCADVSEHLSCWWAVVSGRVEVD